MNFVKRLEDSDEDRWDRFVGAHELATIYHTNAWKRVVQATYGHEPMYLYIEGDDGEIRAGLPCFIVRSKLTGDRLSSIPCAQSCDPLINDHVSCAELFRRVAACLLENNAGYYELKMSSSCRLNREVLGEPLNSYSTYVLDLRRNVDDILRSFHKSCVQNCIRKAHRSGLTLHSVESMDEMKEFYNMYLRMRKCHGLLPQPRRFFDNVWREFSPGGNLDILYACHENRPVSSVLLLKYGDTATYEYGATCPKQFSLRPVHFLLWEAIKKAKLQGYTKFDLGRCAVDNTGLTTFKLRWGAKECPLNYYYLPALKGFASARGSGLSKKLMLCAMKGMPYSWCHLAGCAMYRHLT